MSPGPALTLEAVLAESVSAGGSNKPFGEMTRAEVDERAAELRLATGWGPMARVAPVARAWQELATAMKSGDAATVADLPEDYVLALAPKLWVVPPGGSLLA